MSNTIPTDQEWKEYLAEIDRLRMEVSVRGNMNEGLRADNDHLRAELVRLEWVDKFSKDTVADNDRLRAENEQLSDIRKLLIKAMIFATGYPQEDIEEAPVTLAMRHSKERDRLRAENAEFRNLLEMCLADHLDSECFRIGTVKVLKAALAKTAKEGE